MKNKIFILVAVAVFGIYSHGYAQTKMTLRQCIETGLANNLDVLRSQLQTQSDKITMNQQKLNLLPDLNAAAGQTWSQGRSIDPYSNSPVTQGVSSSNYSISSGIVLFNGFARLNAIKQYSLAYEASKMDWQQIKDNLTINIILAYLQVLNNEELLNQAKNQAALSEKQVERLDLLNKEGAIKPSDLSDLKGQYASDQLSIINQQNSLETAKISLAQLLNIPYSQSIELEPIVLDSPDVKYADGPDQVYQNALKNLAIIKAVDLRQQSAEKAVKVQRGLLYPRLTFGGGASTAYSSVALQRPFLNTTYVPSSDSAIINNVKYPVYKFQDNFGAASKIGFKDQLDNNVQTYYGFNLTVPLFSSLQQRNNVKKAKLTLKLAEYTAQTTRTQLNQSVNQAYINMSSASDRYKTTIEQVAAYGESFRAAEIRFNEGALNSVEYLIVKNYIDRANINLINVKYDYVLRMKVLDYYEGKSLW
jgi:outer membrane protein